MTVARVPIAIHDNIELIKFGFDGSRFRKVNRDDLGAYEWAGPCPQCGGEDRCIVSNGFYWCRQCNAKGNLASRSNGKFKIDPKEVWKIKLEQERKEKEKRQDRLNSILQLNKSKCWEDWHRDLLKNFHLLRQLENDGITMRAINRYQLGYTKAFRAYDYTVKKWVNVPALSFPHFSMIDRSKCLNIRMRILDRRFVKNNAKYLPWKVNMPVLFFPAFDDKDQEEVVIIEGEKKAIVLKEHGIPAIGLWGIHMLKDEWIPWIIKRFPTRYLVYDADNWGVIQATYKQAERLQAKPAFLDLPGKADDLLVAGDITATELMEQIK